GRAVSMADLEDRLFRLPVEQVGDIWMIVATDDAVHFRVEAARPDSGVYREAEKEIGGAMGIPLVIDPMPPQTLFPEWLLLEPSGGCAPRTDSPPHYGNRRHSSATTPRGAASARRDCSSARCPR